MEIASVLSIRIGYMGTSEPAKDLSFEAYSLKDLFTGAADDHYLRVLWRIGSFSKGTLSSV